MRRLSERYLVPFGDWEKPLVSDSATVGTSGIAPNSPMICHPIRPAARVEARALDSYLKQPKLLPASVQQNSQLASG